MGWKSSITLTRNKAISLILERALTATDDELTNALDSLGYGDNTDLPYYGYNFSIGEDDKTEGVEDEGQW